MSTLNFQPIVLNINISYGAQLIMANIDPGIIRQIGDAIGKSIASEIGKSISSQMANQGNPERVGRGGNANGVSPNASGPTGRGDIKSVQELTKSVKLLKDRMGKIAGGTILGMGESKFLNALNLRQGLLDSFVADAKNIRDNEDSDSVYYKLAQKTIEYIEASGTKISALDDLPQAIERYRIKLHELSKSTDDASKLSDEFKSLISNIQNLKDASGNTVDLFEAFDDESKQVIMDIKTHGIEVDKTSDRYKNQVTVMGELSEVMKHSADIISETTKSVANNYETMMLNSRKQFMSAMKMVAVAGAAGVGQMINDAFRAYDYMTPVGAFNATAWDLKGTALSMGMSMRDLQMGMMQYRDVLRNEASILGRGVFDGDTIEQIQDMGHAFGLNGQEAFHFGMRMRETAMQLGISSEASRDSYRTMTDMYKETAKTMNMSVSEFGDFMNEISSDPAMAGIANVIRSQGGDLQSRLANEIKLRAQTNKLLGLSNEQIKEQIMLENAKKWAPITERYRADVGVQNLVKQLEKSTGMTLSDEAKEAMRIQAFDPAAMNDEQRKLFQEQVVPFLRAAPAAYNEEISKMSEGMNFNQQMGLARQAAIQKELIRQYSDMAGTTDYLAQSEAVLANMQKFIGESNFTNQDVINAMAGTLERTPDNEELFSRIDTALGKTEASPEAPGFIQKILEGLDFFTGIGVSGFGKAVGAFGGAVAIFAKTVLMNQLAQSALLGRMGFKGGGIMGWRKQGIGIIGGDLTKSIGKLGAVSKVAAVGGVAFLATEVAKMGHSFGTWLYSFEGVQLAIADGIDNLVEETKKKMKYLLMGPLAHFWDDEDKPSKSEEDQTASHRRNRLIDRLEAGRYTAGYNTLAEIKNLSNKQLENVQRELVRYRKEQLEKAELVEQEGSTGKSQTQLLEEQNEILREQTGNTDKLVKAEQKKEEERQGAKKRISDQLAAAEAAAAGWKDMTGSAISNAEADYGLQWG
jgi:hypothetical protein